MGETLRTNGNGDTGAGNGVPTNGDGYFICYRTCDDGSPCRRVVPLPRMACYTHWE